MQPQDESTQRRSLRDLTHKELMALVQELGQPAFRVKQLESWLWEKGAKSYDDMTNIP